MVDMLKPPRKFREKDLQKSKGIFDDYAIRKSVHTREGTVAKTPVDDIDIANKKYVDDNIGGGGGFTGTEGSVPFVDTDGTLTEDNTKFFWDNTNKRLGIGIAIPTETLDVVGKIVANDDIITTTQFSVDIVGDATIFSDGSSGMILSVGGGEAINILTSGNVGIGVIDPDAKLEVAGTSHFQGNMVVDGTVDGIDLATDIAANTTHRGSDGSEHADVATNTAAKHTQGTDTTLGSGAVAADHGTPATDQIVNVCYGTGSPPTANTTTIGTLFVKYTA